MSKKTSKNRNNCLGDKMAASNVHFDKNVYKKDHYKNNKYLSAEDKKRFARKSVRYFELEAEINKKLGEIYAKRAKHD